MIFFIFHLVPYEPQPVSPASVHSLSSFSPNKPDPKATGFDKVKSNLSSRNDKEKVVYVEEYLANKDVHDAKKVRVELCFKDTVFRGKEEENSEKIFLLCFQDIR